MSDKTDRIFATGTAATRSKLDLGGLALPSLEVLFWEEDTKDLWVWAAPALAWQEVDLATGQAQPTQSGRIAPDSGSGG